MVNMFNRCSIEELLDMEQALKDHHMMGKRDSSRKLIEYYKILHKKIRADRSGEFKHLQEYSKGKLVDYLIRYGTYLKMEKEKDHRVAEDSLKLALQYDRNLPIAYYRLGFLTYQEKRYEEALVHFQKALSLNKTSVDRKYQLNEQQNRFARLYFINSSLHIATDYKQMLDGKEGMVEPVPGYDLSPIYKMMDQYEQYLSAYKIVSNEGEEFCTKDDIDNYLTEVNRIILYFSDRANYVFFNGKEGKITSNKAELLRYLLLYGKENRPVTAEDLVDLFSTRTRNAPNNDNVKQTVKRLKDDLQKVQIPRDVIQHNNNEERNGYYYTGVYPFTIIHRPDMDFLLP